MTENVKISEKFEKIGKELIENEAIFDYLKSSLVKIIYVESDKLKKSQGKVIFGECEKVNDKNKFAIDADFIIRVYKINCLGYGFSEEQYKILIFHELLHAGIKYDKKGNEHYYIIPHDIEEFNLIKSKFGLNWQTTQKEFDFTQDEAS